MRKLSIDRTSFNYKSIKTIRIRTYCSAFIIKSRLEEDSDFEYSLNDDNVGSLDQINRYANKPVNNPGRD